MAPLLWLFVGCTDPTVGTPVLFEPDGAFWDAPFPSAHRLGPDGLASLDGFPNDDDNPYVAQLVDLIDGRLDGFGTTSAVFFRIPGGAASEGLPTLAGSVRDDAAVFLIGVDGPDAGVRVPVETAWMDDSGPFGARDHLVVLPLQGRPLAPDATYAAVVTRAVVDAAGEPLAASALLLDLARGRDVLGGASADYAAALDRLDRDEGLAARDLAGLAVFRTQAPTTELARLVTAARARPAPSPTDFVLSDVLDDYCVYRATIDLPVFQQGEPPYLDGGGTIGWQGEDAVFVRDEAAHVDVTVPRAPTPSGGWPVAVFVRAGGGGERPLVDRGVHDATGALRDPGGGPARYFAAAGYAGVSVDGPHGGLRNVTHGDEQFLMYNFGNPGATRDNLRQSAAELALLPDWLATTSVDVTDCPGAAGPATFATDRLALMGHSTGASIAPLAAWAERRYDAVILSGSGGSWIHNIVYKESPLVVRPLAEGILGYDQTTLTPFDPVLTLLQWGGELADVPVFARDLTEADVLQFQGIVDTYILPPIASAATLSLGLDLAGDALDASSPELAAYTPVAELLAVVGGAHIALPASENRPGRTAVAVQHPEDGIEDGHEVVFQTPDPKHQYRCFLASRRAGVPVVPDGGASGACP